jgi:O-antigen ligase
MLPIAFRLFIYYRPPKKNLVFFFGGAFCLGIIALFTTYGRAPWVGFAAAIFLIVIWSSIKARFRSRNRWTIPILIIFSVLFLFRYHNSIIIQFTSSRKASTNVRFPQFRIARRMIAANPIKGVGLGNYELNSWDYMTNSEKRHTYARTYAMMVHNAYLFVTAETGIIGGVFLLAWFFSVFWVCFRILKSRVTNDFIVNVTLGIFGGMIAIAIVFTYSPDIHEYQILYQIGLFNGLLIAMLRMIQNARRKMKQSAMQNKSGRTLKTVRIS